MANDKIMNDSLTKLMDKIGITGIASAAFTIMIGFFIIIYDITWEEAKLLIGFYFIIVGLINLIGYVYSMYSQHKVDTTYVEMETLKTKDLYDDDEKK